jgi:hypothetical protein
MRTEASVSPRGLLAIARLLAPWAVGSTNVLRLLKVFCELIIGMIVDALVLALGIFILVLVACVALP